MSETLIAQSSANHHQIIIKKIRMPPCGRMDRSLSNSVVPRAVLVCSGSRVPSDAGQAFQRFSFLFYPQLGAPLATLDPKVLSVIRLRPLLLRHTIETGGFDCGKREDPLELTRSWQQLE
eukprot:2789868-Prymnesium_polylepis.3